MIVVVNNKGLAAMRSFKVRSSSTSHCAHTNLPARNFASSLASQTAKSAASSTAAKG